MSQIKIRIEVDLYPKSKTADRVMQKLINNNFKTVLEESNSYEFPLYDEKYSGNYLLDLLVEEIYYDETSPFWGKKTQDEIRQYIMTAGITPEKIIDWVKNTLLISNPSRSIQKLFELNPKEKKIIERGEEFIKKYGPGMSIEDIKCLDKIKNERVVVVRSQFGEYDLISWNIPGGSITSNDSRINHLKACYSYLTGCPYFQARPVLYTTWLNLSDEMKYQTYNKNNDEI